jgi:hypothetical protein
VVIGGLGKVVARGYRCDIQLKLLLYRYITILFRA